MGAIFIGRFQPFHNGHLYALKKIAKKYKNIFVIIGSANKSFEKQNPFTLSERIKMLKMVAKKNNIKISILPIDDVENDELWLESIVKKIKKIDVVFSNNNWVKRIFKKSGYVVKSTGRYARGVNKGRYIRKLMAEGKEWEKHVPAEVVDYIKKIKGEQRIRKLFFN